ncbi:myb-like protein X isoform X2 [Cylas formicarius]|uniref:myb-like protein X isoform X2 n=1 Tax=Cylas formicarius TaxID=197179 RepID=UPI002958B803|nr:myb-like protein X isoform X2 [Cylas formicarius]
MMQVGKFKRQRSSSPHRDYDCKRPKSTDTNCYNKDYKRSCSTTFQSQRPTPSNSDSYYNKYGFKPRSKSRDGKQRQETLIPVPLPHSGRLLDDENKTFKSERQDKLKLKNKVQEIQEYKKKIKDDKPVETEYDTAISAYRYRSKNIEKNKDMQKADDKSSVALLQNSEIFKKVREEKEELKNWCKSISKSRESEEEKEKREKALDYKNDVSRFNSKDLNVKCKSYHDKKQTERQSEKIRDIHSHFLEQKSFKPEDKLSRSKDDKKFNRKSRIDSHRDTIDICKTTSKNKTSRSISRGRDREIEYEKIGKKKVDPKKSRSSSSNSSKKESTLIKKDKDNSPKKNKQQNTITSDTSTLEKHDTHQNEDNNDLDLLILQDFEVIEEDFAEENEYTKEKMSTSKAVEKRRDKKYKTKSTDKTGTSFCKRKSSESTRCHKGRSDSADKRKEKNCNGKVFGNKHDYCDNTTELLISQDSHKLREDFNVVKENMVKSQSRDKEIKYKDRDEKRNKTECNSVTKPTGPVHNRKEKKSKKQQNKTDFETRNKIESPNGKILQDCSKIEEGIGNDTTNSEDIISLEQKRKTLLEQLELDVTDDSTSVTRVAEKTERKKIVIISDIHLSSETKKIANDEKNQISCEKALEAIDKENDLVEPRTSELSGGQRNRKISDSSRFQGELKDTLVKEDDNNYSEEKIFKDDPINSRSDSDQNKCSGVIFQKDENKVSDNEMSAQGDNDRSIKCSNIPGDEVMNVKRKEEEKETIYVNQKKEDKEMISETQVQIQLDVGASKEALLCEDSNKMQEIVKYPKITKKAMKLKRRISSLPFLKSPETDNQNEKNEGSNEKDIEGSSSNVSHINLDSSEEDTIIPQKHAKPNDKKCRNYTLNSKRKKGTTNTDESQGDLQTINVALQELGDNSKKIETMDNLIDTNGAQQDPEKQIWNVEMDEIDSTKTSEGVVQTNVDITKEIGEKSEDRQSLSISQYNDLLEQLELSSDSIAEQSKSLEDHTKPNQQDHATLIKQIVNEVAQGIYKPSLKRENKEQNIKNKKPRGCLSPKKKAPPKSKSLFPTIRLGKPSKKGLRSKANKSQKEKCELDSPRESESDKETPTVLANTPIVNKVVTPDSSEANSLEKPAALFFKKHRVSRGKSMTRLEAMYKMEQGKETAETSSVEMKSPEIISSTLAPRGRNRSNRSIKSQIREETTPKTRRNSVRSCRIGEPLSECRGEPSKSVKTRRQSAIEKNAKQEEITKPINENDERIVSSPLATFENMLEQSSKSAKNSPVSKMNIEEMPIIHIEEGTLGDVISLQNNTLLHLVDMANVNGNILSGKEREEENMTDFTKYLSANKSTSTPFKKSDTQKCIDFQDQECVVKLVKVVTQLSGNSAGAVDSSEKQLESVKLSHSGVNSSNDSTKKMDFTFGVPIRRSAKRPRVVLMEQ